MRYFVKVLPLLILCLSLPTLAQTSHSASGVVSHQGETLKVADAVGYWDGSSLRILLFEHPLNDMKMRKLKDPTKRRELITTEPYANVTVLFGGGYTAKDVTQLNFVISNPPRRTSGGGVSGPNLVSRLTGEFPYKDGSSVEISAHYKNTSFQASCPVYAWGQNYKTVSK